MSRVDQIRASARAGARLVRCDGSLEELRQYRYGSVEPGWSNARRPRRGDLLLGCVGRGASRMVVSLCLVEAVEKGQAIWTREHDVPISPPISYVEVMRTAGLPARPRPAYEGAEGEAVLDALAGAIGAVSTLSAGEGEARLTICRGRSRTNRKRKLADCDGSCQACGTNLRDLFGDQGDRALEVHHLGPLADQSPGGLETSLDELAVVCATCHRLVHADPNLSLERLRLQWLLQV